MEGGVASILGCSSVCTNVSFFISTFNFPYTHMLLCSGMLVYFFRLMGTKTFKVILYVKFHCKHFYLKGQIHLQSTTINGWAIHYEIMDSKDNLYARIFFILFMSKFFQLLIIFSGSQCIFFSGRDEKTENKIGGNIFARKSS